MLKWNQKWQEPEWRIPKVPAADYVREYAEHSRKIPGVLGVWALVDYGTLYIYTLIEANRETERQLHEIELKVFDKWPDEEIPVDFRIYRDEESLSQYVKGIEPVLVAS
jgi:hypothetical protein